MTRNGPQSSPPRAPVSVSQSELWCQRVDANTEGSICHRSERISPRLFLSSLADNGGRIRTLELSYSLSKKLRNDCSGELAPEIIQEVFLDVTSIAGRLDAMGVVSYSERDGTVRLIDETVVRCRPEKGE